MICFLVKDYDSSISQLHITYLAGRKLVAEVDAICNKSQADGEPSHPESADQERDAVAVSAQ